MYSKLNWLLFLEKVDEYEKEGAGAHSDACHMITEVSCWPDACIEHDDYGLLVIKGIKPVCIFPCILFICH